MSGLALLLFTPVPYAQTQGSISGLVLDSPAASVPATSVIATENFTGVATKTTSNESGVCSFPTLQATRSGFQSVALNDIRLDVPARLTLIAERSTSVRGVVGGQQVLALPVVSRNVLNFAILQAGTFGESFSGTRRGALNINVDGINVQDSRINLGVSSTTTFTVDRIEEFRVVTSPADAEYSQGRSVHNHTSRFRVVTSPADAEYDRGSGQIQLISRSGGNRFSGSLFESHRNTAFNANTWFNNQRGSDAVGNPISPRNILLRHQFGGRIGGPIKKNKTFFHFNYEQQTERTRDAVIQTVLTGPARQGQFRFFPGVRNFNADSGTPIVDLNGNPIAPAGATLSSLNLFTLDPSGGIARLLTNLSLPNNFCFGDGLNTAGYTWSRSLTDDTRQWAMKVDQNWTDRQRTSVSYDRETGDALNGFMAQRYPDAPGGTQTSIASVLSLRHTTTIINEFTGGFQRPRLRGNVTALIKSSPPPVANPTSSISPPSLTRLRIKTPRAASCTSTAMPIPSPMSARSTPSKPVPRSALGLFYSKS